MYNGYDIGPPRDLEVGSNVVKTLQSAGKRVIF
jgi:hypothetical protein